MGYRMDLKDADRMFAKLQEEYEIWAPKRFVGKGRYSDTDLILSLIHISEPTRP